MPEAKSLHPDRKPQVQKPEPGASPPEQALAPETEAELLARLSIDAATSAGEPPAQGGLLHDQRLGVAQRQSLAAQLGRVGGNQFLQRAVVQREGEGNIKDRLREAMEGVGTDEDEIYAILGSASRTDKQSVLSDRALMEELVDEMSGEELLRALELLGANLADRLRIATEGAGTDEEMIVRILRNATPDERAAALNNAAILASLFDELPLEEMLDVTLRGRVLLKERVQMALDPWNAPFSVVQSMAQAATDVECATVWTDRALLDRIRGRYGEQDYLNFLVAVRMTEAGTTAEDSSTHTSATDADDAVQAHLATYLHGALLAGRQIEGMVAIVDDEDWNRAGVRQYGATVWNGGKRDSINGFVDGQGRVWIHRNRGNAGTMIHEAIHKYAVNTLNQLNNPLNEGVTEYFTRKVCAAMTPPITGRLNYQDNLETVEDLVLFTSEAAVAAAYFDGDIPTLRSAVDALGEGIWTSFMAHARAQEWELASLDLMSG